MVYRFINDNKAEFGVRWLLHRIKLSANAYYNYLKGKKDDYRNNKKKILTVIDDTYHETNGIVGYRTIKIFLNCKGIDLSNVTVHKYMNKELKLKSVTQKKKPSYKHGDAHKKFANILNQDFTAAEN
ncbi:hypothetical protein [Clostridium butyricum]|uniref:hypothetical protein n=1 Tax=Clostridium butyricum TaxID=1492 RepID=UPI0026BCA24C